MPCILAYLCFILRHCKLRFQACLPQAGNTLDQSEYASRINTTVAKKSGNFKGKGVKKRLICDTFEHFALVSQLPGGIHHFGLPVVITSLFQDFLLAGLSTLG